MRMRQEEKEVFKPMRDGVMLKDSEELWEGTNEVCQRGMGLPNEPEWAQLALMVRGGGGGVSVAGDDRLGL